jgi:hypothetical protein
MDEMINCYSCGEDYDYDPEVIEPDEEVECPFCNAMNTPVEEES